MARLALGDPMGRRRISDGCGLHRPALGREIGGDLAKIVLRKPLGYGRHDRIVAIATSVVVQLLDEIALLLTPDDRNGFWVDGYAILAVACSARLRFCLNVVRGIRRYGSERKANSPENRRKRSCKHVRSSLLQVSVTTDVQGRYTFPENRLDPGEYTISIRAVGYDISSPTKATVESEKTTTTDIRLKKTKNLASQLTNAEWMMSIPGTEEQKAMLLNCVGCHTLERIMRSTHDSDEWTQVITRMMGYGAVSQPIKPQPMLDRSREGTPEQYRKMADYLASINLSSVDRWQYELKTLPRPKGPDTRAIVTEYDMVRPTTEPHDILVDKDRRLGTAAGG